MEDKLVDFSYADKKDLDQLFSIDGVEVFAPGKWNGENYTLKDLSDMVDAQEKVGFNVPLKAGHAEEEGAPALGWVKNLRVIGNKLVADFRDIPSKIYEVIKSHGWDSVSSEIFWNLERDGKIYRRVLKAVALLGIEIPAVAGLKPLRDVVFSGGGKFKTVTYKSEDHEMEKIEELTQKAATLETQLAEQKKIAETTTNEAKAEAKALKAQLESTNAKLVEMSENTRKERITKKVADLKIPAFRKFMQALYDATTTETKTVKFSQKEGDAAIDTAIESVIDSFVVALNQKSERMFAETGNSQTSERKEGSEITDNPAEETDRRVKEYIEKNPKTEYKIALHKVLDADPELKKAYAGVS